MPLIAEQLTVALTTLEKYYELSASLGATAHPELVDRFHKATIKSFDDTYELSVTLLRRVLDTGAAQIEHSMLLRLAAQRDLIDDSLFWFLFRECRKATTRTYDEAVARDILPVMPIFIGKVRQLLETQRRQSDAPA